MSSPTSRIEIAEGCVNDAFGIIGTLRRIARRATAPAGFGRVTLSLHPKGVEKVMAFLKQAFDAEKYSALLRPRESFITRRSGSATLCSNRRSSWTVQPMPSAIFSYVPDAAASYKRALDAGATSLWAPAQMYGDLMSGVADPFGNDWYIAKHLGSVTQ
jgi:PhnB protein